MTITDKPIEDLTETEILEALVETPQPPVNTLEETAEELKAMGIRDISEADDLQREALKEAIKNIQFQRSLQDYERGSVDKKTPKDYLLQHVEFLVRISPGKTKEEIIQNMNVEHAQAALKITAKMDLPEPLVKKHLKWLKKKYS